MRKRYERQCLAMKVLKRAVANAKRTENHEVNPVSSVRGVNAPTPPDVHVPW